MFVLVTPSVEEMDTTDRQLTIQNARQKLQVRYVIFSLDYAFSQKTRLIK